MSENVNNYFSIITQSLCALGPLLLGTIAIYGDRIKIAIFKPKLNISIDKYKPCVELVTTDVSDARSSDNNQKYIVVRVKVENSGKIPAKNCIALAQKVWKMNDSGKFHEIKQFAPTQFLWFNEQKEYTIPKEIQSYLEIVRIKETDVITENNNSDLTDNINKKSLIYLSIPEPGKKGVFVELGVGKFIISIVTFAEDVKCSDVKYLDIYWKSSDVTKTDDLTLEILSQTEFDKKEFVKINRKDK